MKTLLNELSLLRWDTLDHKEMEREILAFYQRGNNSDFYTHTLETILLKMREVGVKYNTPPTFKEDRE